jgi:hypothetical protein
MYARNPERGRDGLLTSLILPTYNPGALLSRTWQAVEQFLKTTAGSWEVLFVCDGCTDGARDRLEAWNRNTSHPVRVLSYPANRGKGYAVRYGLAQARGDYRLFTDVDLAYGFDDILRAARALEGGADVVIGSRSHPDSQMVLPTRLQGYVYRRHLQSLVFSALVRWLLPLKQRDTQAGLKGMSAATALRLLPHLSCDGFGFDCELLTACVRLGLSITEVPVCVRYEDRASTTNVGTMSRMLRELWQIRCAWRQAPAALSTASDLPSRRAA